MFHLFLQAACNVHVSVLSARSDANVKKKPSDDVELAHRSLFGFAALIEPLPVGCGGEDGTVLAAPSVRLQGDLSLPVLEAHAGAWLVHPLAVGHKVIDA